MGANSEDQESQSSQGNMILIGVVAMVTGQLFHALQSIYEEYILQGASKQEPCYLMGWEGIYGIIFTVSLIIPASIFDCPFEEAQCVNGHLEDLSMAKQQLVSSPILIVYGFMLVLASFTFNGFGVTTVKYTSATARSVVEQTRTMTVWTFFLLKPGFGHEEFSWLKMGGFVMIFSGVLFFNKILEFDGLSVKWGEGATVTKAEKHKELKEPSSGSEDEDDQEHDANECTPLRYCEEFDDDDDDNNCALRLNKCQNNYNQDGQQHFDIQMAVDYDQHGTSTTRQNPQKSSSKKERSHSN